MEGAFLHWAGWPQSLSPAVPTQSPGVLRGRVLGRAGIKVHRRVGDTLESGRSNFSLRALPDKTLPLKPNLQLAQSGGPVPAPPPEGQVLPRLVLAQRPTGDRGSPSEGAVVSGEGRGARGNADPQRRPARRGRSGGEGPGACMRSLPGRKGWEPWLLTSCWLLVKRCRCPETPVPSLGKPARLGCGSRGTPTPSPGPPPHLRHWQRSCLGSNLGKEEERSSGTDDNAGRPGTRTHVGGSAP